MFDTGTRIGRYEIGRKLGQGGFGILYAARDHELGRDVAIKFLRPEHAFRPQVVQRFLQEARAAARISDPGIVTVYESGQVSGTSTRGDGTVYIAMELLAGDTLANRLRQSGRMPYRMAIGFCRQIATALAAAHSAGIVHRDLKPQNIFLVPDKAVLGGERVKVLDFGIAKLVDDMGSALNTHSMLMLGTPMYMSPEQCKSSARVDARSDIYSLGCILFEMVCGKPPFDGDSGELIAKHQLVAAPSARSLDPELPIVLDQLITAMLAKNPDERPQTMSSVLDVLDECEERSLEPPTSPSHQLLLADTPSMMTVDDPVAAPPVSRQAPVFSRRMIIGIAGIALIAIGVSVGLAVRSRRHAEPARAPAALPIAQTAPADAAAGEPAPAVEPAAADAALEPPVESAKDLNLVCLRAQLEKRWADLADCGHQLEALEPGQGAPFVDTATAENDNEQALGRLEEAIHDKDLVKAKRALDEIEDSSVFYRLAQTIYTTAQPTGAVAAKQPPAVKTAKPTAKKCDEEALLDQGLAEVRKGKHAAALTSFEASLRCQPDQYIEKLAFVAACNSKDAAKARAHYAQLTNTQRDEVTRVCERNKITFNRPPASCDAEALKEKGMELINTGEHARALAQFEAALKCKQDPYVIQLAFMEACTTRNNGKAKLYYRQLTPAGQQKFAQICIRNKTAYE